RARSSMQRDRFPLSPACFRNNCPAAWAYRSNPSLAAQPDAAKIRSDADYLERVTRRVRLIGSVKLPGRVKGDLLADGALARPELPRRGLADDGHRRPSASFLIGEGAPFHNRDTQGIEVIGSHVAVIHRGSS